MIAALAENLRLIRTEGIESVWQRARLLGRATRAGIEAIGLEVFAQRPADGLTSVRLPEDLDSGAFLKALETRFGVKVAGGQAHLKGKIFRIAHMGIVDELDILGTLSAVELVLDGMGWQVELGAGTTAATQVLAGRVSSAV
jgi:aspartate aminotransferase-like enzyme